MHHSIDLFHLSTLMHNSFIHYQYVCYITILDMFRASALIRHTVQLFTESDDTRCCDNTIGPPEDGHVDAQNKSRIVT
jgi:hypothetical protein